MDDLLPQLKPLLLNVGLAALAIGVAIMLFRRWRQLQEERRARNAPPPVQEPPTDETNPDDDTIPLANLRTTVRKWKVSGVEKSTGNDATWVIDAESRANAKVKAELKGMIVTAVERV